MWTLHHNSQAAHEKSLGQHIHSVSLHLKAILTGSRIGNSLHQSQQTYRETGRREDRLLLPHTQTATLVVTQGTTQHSTQHELVYSDTVDGVGAGIIRNPLHISEQSIRPCGSKVHIALLTGLHGGSSASRPIDTIRQNAIHTTTTNKQTQATVQIPQT